MKRNLEKRILEKELLEPPRQGIPSVYKPKRRRKIRIKAGVSYMFVGINGFYDKARGFYKGLSKL